ncbi:transposase, partial [Emticicia agri]
MQFTLIDLDSPNFSRLYIFKNKTELGAIYQTIDWPALVKLLPQKRTKVGSPSLLPAQGYFGLMFLKHYLKLSDEKLLERLNTDWAIQMFCGVQLKDYQMIRDNAFVSNVRTYLAKHIDLGVFQQTLISQWKQEIPDKQVVSMDASCYEVYIRFPTDVKLLWESCQWLWEKQIPSLCSTYRIKLPRSKFKEQKIKYVAYSKLRKKSHRKTRSRQNALLKLLYKAIEAYQLLLNQTQAKGLSIAEAETFKTIKLVYQQQRQRYLHHQAKIPNRIVSLYKPYIRPIVRGKENKPVEFGMKVHKLQVGGISMIEHCSYEAFNEYKRLKLSIIKHKSSFGVCTHIAADRIYATNENRRYTTKKDIQTNFVRKGAGKDDKATKQIKTLLNKERATRLEGSFGTEKEHYLLHKNKARSADNEQVWLYFGIHTANAVLIAKRRQKAQ